MEGRGRDGGGDRGEGEGRGRDGGGGEEIGERASGGERERWWGGGRR